MAIRVEHQLHTRRKGRNIGVGLVLVGFVAIIFGLTVVKVQNLDGNIGQMEAPDHVVRPAIIPEEGASE